MDKEDETVKFKNYTRKIKLPCMIYPDFQSILIPENNGEQKLDGPYPNEYQSHVGHNFGCKLVRVDDQFSKPFKSYLGQDAVHNAINNMVK